MQYLREKGMRRTPERAAVLERLFSDDRHFHADELRDIMEKDGYHVSLSTVYSTLKVLVEAGLARMHRFGGEQPAQYERVAPDSAAGHYHLVCTSCGRVSEVSDSSLSLRQITRRHYSSFEPAYCMVYVYGTCYRCLKRLRREQRRRLDKSAKTRPAHSPSKPKQLTNHT